jgi:uncharacterized protein
MKKVDGALQYSPSDLITYSESKLDSWLSRLLLEAPEKLEGACPTFDSMMIFLQGKGNKHEKEYLQQLITKYGNEQVYIVSSRGAEAYDDTLQALQSGQYQVIYQACLKREEFGGYADFLMKQVRDDDTFYYAPWDTKLARSVKDYAVLQLCCYAWMLEGMQGYLSDEIGVILGDDEKTAETLCTQEVYSDFEKLLAQFMQAQKSFVPDFRQIPDPALHNVKSWREFAQLKMEEADSLGLIADIRKTQITKLYAANIFTREDLVKTVFDKSFGISEKIFDRLRMQADLQLQSKDKLKPLYKVIGDDGKGFSSLPNPSNMDVYFDIEGDPHAVDGGIEYLWGVTYEVGTQPNIKNAYKDWWGHTSEQEKMLFESFVNWIEERRQQDPAMHIYHYASYEVTALKKLSSRYQIKETVVQNWITEGVLVDLYKIVKNGLVVGEPSYSIKNIEHLYRGKRITDVKGGSDSIVEYEKWRESKLTIWNDQPHGWQMWSETPDTFDWAHEDWKLIKAIRDYNKDDCDSTLELVKWLRVEKAKYSFA